jgi:hypothetical protein
MTFAFPPIFPRSHQQKTFSNVEFSGARKVTKEKKEEWETSRYYAEEKEHAGGIKFGHSKVDKQNQ